MARPALAMIRSVIGLTPLWLYSGLTQAHGQRHAPSPWHKLEFWNGEFHLFAMIFWLSLIIIVVASLVKLIKRVKEQRNPDR